MPNRREGVGDASVEVQVLQVVHFGGGSLGLGLVVATLVEAGARVTVVDADAGLVAALRDRGGYDLEVHDGPALRTQFVPVAAAVEAGGAAVGPVLRGADLVTTSVRVPNLPAVAEALAAALDWAGAPSLPRVVACENLAGSSHTLAAALEGVRSWDPGLVSRTFLDAEVDRICQTAWPQRLAVATEPYREWAVRDPEGTLATVAGVNRVDDLAPYFDRKRAFVNAVADACAFLGVARGLTYLHEAAADPAAAAAIERLHDDLVRYVARWPQFDPADLRGYAAVSLRRLANPGIRRRLDTVARDLERKLAAGERFVEPALTLLRAGHPPVGLARVVAALLDTEPRAWSRDWVAEWGADEPARRFWAMIAAERRAP